MQDNKVTTKYNTICNQNNYLNSTSHCRQNSF